MKTLFTSDDHFFHKNILTYSKRPFKDITEMNEMLIKNWNSVVNSEDHVYNLGDVAFCNNTELDKILYRLNGKIFHIKGNHCGNIKTDRFEWSKDYFELNIQDKDVKKGSQLIVLCHYPLATWNHSYKGSISLHGHCHGNLKKDFNLYRMDVGVDCHQFFPISYEQIKQEFKKNYNPPTKDHHNNDIDL